MDKTIKLVIFDLDGTLVDAYKAVSESLNHALVALGYDVVDHELVKRRVGCEDRHLVGEFVAQGDIDKVLSIFRQHHPRALKQGTVFLPGARELLVELKSRQYLTAIASNRPTRFAQIILKHLNIKDLFDYVLCADKVDCPKPSPEILCKILQKFSISSGNALYVGDMTIDVETGHRARVKTIAVVTGSSSRGDIVEANPFRVISHIREVSEILKDLDIRSDLSR